MRLRQRLTHLVGNRPALCASLVYANSLSCVVHWRPSLLLCFNTKTCNFLRDAPAVSLAVAWPMLLLSLTVVATGAVAFLADARRDRRETQTAGQRKGRDRRHRQTCEYSLPTQPWCVNVCVIFWPFKNTWGVYVLYGLFHSGCVKCFFPVSVTE